MSTRSIGSTTLVVTLAFIAGLLGAGAWNFAADILAERKAAATLMAKDEAVVALRTDQAACSRGLVMAANTCAALVRFDRAAQQIAAWAEPVDRPAIQTTLASIRDSILKLESPSWVHALDWIEEGALRRARALDAAAKTLAARPDGADKVALSARLSDILKEKLLEDTHAP